METLQSIVRYLRSGQKLNRRNNTLRTSTRGHVNGPTIPSGTDCRTPRYFDRLWLCT